MKTSPEDPIPEAASRGPDDESVGTQPHDPRAARAGVRDDDDSHAVLEAVASEIRGRIGVDARIALDIADSLRGRVSARGAELHVVVGADVAFVVHVSEAPPPSHTGRRLPRSRTTYGLTRAGGRWMVVHEHVSNPAPDDPARTN